MPERNGVPPPYCQVGVKFLTSRLTFLTPKEGSGALFFCMEVRYLASHYDWHHLGWGGEGWLFVGEASLLLGVGESSIFIFSFLWYWRVKGRVPFYGWWGLESPCGLHWHHRRASVSPGRDKKSQLPIQSSLIPPLQLGGAPHSWGIADRSRERLWFCSMLFGRVRKYGLVPSQ